MSDEAPSPLAGARMRYLFVAVHDLDEVTAFYRRDLGLELEHHEPGRCSFLRLGGGSQSLALYAGGHPEALQDVSEPRWFVTMDVDDLDGVVAALRARGVAVDDPFDVPHGRAAKLRDPEGHTLELHQPTRPTRSETSSSLSE